MCCAEPIPDPWHTRGQRISSAVRLGLAVTAGLVATGIGVNSAGADPISDAIPTGAEAGFVVFDRTAGRATVELDSHKQFRSASVVKLLIAIDYLESHDAQHLPAADAERLQAMLRSSDDDVASYLWIQDGWQTIIDRMVARIGLTDTAPPAARGMWGYTAISAADVVQIYRYILERADPAVRRFIMDNLHASTKCGQDGFDQSFGIGRALGRPAAVKQGWSGFGDAPDPDKLCTPSNPKPPIPADALSASAAKNLTFGPDGIREMWSPTQGTPPEPPAINLTKRAMHTTGTAGVDDEKIIVLLSLEPTGTPWDVSAQRITVLTKAIDLANWSETTGLGAH